MALECFESYFTLIERLKEQRRKTKLFYSFFFILSFQTIDGNTTNATFTPITETTDEPTSGTCQVVREDECSWFNAASITMVSSFLVIECAVVNIISLMM